MFLIQVIFYRTDFERQFSDVLSGFLDIGFVPSGWLEEHHPDKMSELYFHYSNLSINLYQRLGVPTLFQSQPIPFVTSTDLIPLNALSAHPSITTLLREQVRQWPGSLC